MSNRLASDCLSTSQCYAPRQFRVAYGIRALLDHGIDGSGQTVVLVEFAAPAGSAPRVTDIRQDLARFDSVFGLPAASLQIVNSLARSPSPWLANSEEAEDTEVVHAVAPDAAIREVLVSDTAAESAANASAGVAAALRLGLTQGAVISFSHSWGEQCFTVAEVAQLNAALRAASKAAVTVVNSSGDVGASTNPCPGARVGLTGIKGVNLLDADPLVLAAGGTSLQANRATGTYTSETVWNTPPGPIAPHRTAVRASPAEPRPVEPQQTMPDVGPHPARASAAGAVPAAAPPPREFSRVLRRRIQPAVLRPAYQDGVPGIGLSRGLPDVAADADPNTGMALVLTDGGRNSIVVGASGTSAAAPMWAAVIALADQYAGRHLGFVNPALYRIGRSRADHTAFHDITTGTNTVESSSQTVSGYKAGPGWDPVTGWGSPDAQILVPLLARYARP